MHTHSIQSRFVVLVTMLCLYAVASPAQSPPDAQWNVPAAVASLDAGALTWDRWERSQRTLDTTCISCHTGGPYLLARAALRMHGGPLPVAEAETNLRADVARRVTHWADAEPWYTLSEAKKTESLGTESVWNAWILAARDAYSADRILGADARAAFEIMWAQQNEQGAWPWLNFAMEPWESLTAAPIGVAMALLAVAVAPEDYAHAPAIQPGLTRAMEYLRAEFDRAGQSTHTRAFILWAAYELDGLLPADARTRAAADLIALQHTDGGWSIADFGDYREEPAAGASDAYATALVMLSTARSEEAAVRQAVARGRAWLIAHQDAESGAWPMKSLNKKREAETYPSHFMQDAATAYAVLALTLTNTEITGD